MKSKAAIFPTFSALIITLLFSACSLPFLAPVSDSQHGSLRLSFGLTGAKTVVPALDMVASTYAVTGTGPSGASFSVASVSGTTLTQSDLMPGTWTINVTAKNAAGTAIGSGTTTVAILVGQSVAASVAVNPLVGTGSFECVVTWPLASLSSVALTGTVTDAAGTPHPLSFSTPSGGQSTATLSLSSGYYSFAVSLTESGIPRWLTKDAVQIASGSVSAARFDLGTSDVTKGQLFAPQFSLAGGSYASAQSLTLSSIPSGKDIYYTNNGTTPNATNGTLYTAPIPLSSTQTITAVAVEAGFLDSQAQTATYTIGTTPAAPTFSPEPGLYYSATNVSLTASNGVDGFVYEAGSGSVATPSQYTSTPYGSAIVVSNGTTTIKAISYKGSAESAVTQATYRVTGYASQPTITASSTDSDAAVTVTLAATGSGETLWYTTNGTLPSPTNGLQYTAPFNVGASCTVRALAVKADWGNSPVASQAIQIRAKAPTSTITSGTYNTAKTIDLGTTTSAATIWFTIDGSLPGPTNGTSYSAPFVLENPSQVRAVALKAGIDSSPELSLTIAYRCADPVPSLAAGTYNNDLAPTLSCATSGASIRYTTNGVVPTSTVGAVYVSGATIPITQAKTLRAISYKDGWQDSVQKDYAYTFQVATPSVTGDMTNGYSITCTTAGASIFYTTDGSTPTGTSTSYSSGTVGVGVQWLRAIATKSGVQTSGIGAGGYSLANFAMVSVPGGTFYNGHSNMTVSAFKMAACDVTTTQWNTIMGGTGGTGGTNQPVIDNWYKTIVFCNKLSIADGRTPAYTINGVSDPNQWGSIPNSSPNATWDNVVVDMSSNGYRLPTEMEWMWAAMGATNDSKPGDIVSNINVGGYTKAFAGSNGSNDINDYTQNPNNSNFPLPDVGKKTPNELGLYDMSGLMYQWCWDWWPSSYPATPATDYSGPSTGTSKVCHGGYFFDYGSDSVVAIDFVRPYPQAVTYNDMTTQFAVRLVSR